MPYKCCVPACKTNYYTSNKLSVFSFPKDEESRKKWTTAIGRNNFIPSKHSRVCELHFFEHEIERVTSMFDEKAGRLVEATLSHPRLKKDAVPSHLPGSPGYMLQSQSIISKPPEQKPPAIINPPLVVVIQESSNLLPESIRFGEKYFANFEEMKRKFNLICLPSEWTVVDRGSYLSAILFDDGPCPKVKCSVQVDRNLSLSVYVAGAEIHSLAQMSFPKRVNDVDTIEKTIQTVNSKLWDFDEEDSVQDIINIILDLFKQLEEILGCGD